MYESASILCLECLVQLAQDTQTQIRQLQQQIVQLQQQYEALQTQVNQTSAKPTYNIERLEYHFDQLKVQRLDGTLNIGMAPPGGSSLQDSIDQLNVPGAPPVPGTDVSSPVNGEGTDVTGSLGASPSNPLTPSPLYQEVFRQVNDYLDRTAPGVIDQMAAAGGITLDHITAVSLLKICGSSSRRAFNFTLHPQPSRTHLPRPASACPEHRAKKTIRDIETAIQQYISKLPAQASAAPAPTAETGTIPTGGTIVTEHSGVEPFEGTE